MRRRFDCNGAAMPDPRPASAAIDTPARPRQDIGQPPGLLLRELTATIPGAKLQLTALPLCPEIKLWLLNPDYPQWQLTTEQAGHIMEQPPFWSFCWASGQVLAAHLLANPSLVAGKTVVDFGAGSGIVAIAALRAGASSAICCDSDATARLACRANAALNGVEIATVSSLADIPGADLVTVADVFYDRDNLPLLREMQARFEAIWVADSRLRTDVLQDNALPGLSLVATRTSHTVPDLAESSEFNHVNLYTDAIK